MGRPSPRVLFVAVAGFALLAAGCQRVANPEGWAPPNVEEGTLYASVDKGRIAALEPDMNPETGADCDDAEDNDGDDAVNEGCPEVAQKSESKSECLNNTSDELRDEVPDDDAVNDGCPAVVVRWLFPPNTDEGNRLDLEGIYGAPIVNEGFVYFGAYDGNVYALDAAEGFLVWALETDDPIVSSLALSAGTLFAGSTDGKLYALDAESGDEIGRFDTGSSIWASPLSAQLTSGFNSVPTMSIIYAATMDGRLHALDPATLTPIEDFSFETDAGLVMDPILADNDTLLVGGIDSKLYGLDPQTGDEQWSFEGGNWFWGKPALRGETAYIPDLDGNVYAVNLVDGRQVWAKPFKTDAAVRSSPLLAGNTLVVVDRSGNAYGVDPDNGAQQWGPTPLGKTVLSDPFLLERAASPGGAESSPSATPGEGSPAATEEPSPTAASGVGAGALVLIVAQGGDLCLLDPSTGLSTQSIETSDGPCREVRL